MIIDTIKDPSLYEYLKQFNGGIEEVTKRYKFNGNYDFKNKVISPWFDPKNVRNLGISRTYPHMCSVQYRPEYSLNLHCSNYLPLFLINELYGYREGTLIEDIGGGMGWLFYYLSKIGFFKYHLFDNFSQLSEEAARDFITTHHLDCEINKNELNPVVSVNVGVPEFVVRKISPQLELVICYTNKTLEAQSVEYFKDKGFSFLCKDIDDLAFAYCRNDLLEEFKAKLAPYAVAEKKTISQYAPKVGFYERVGMIDYMEEPGFLTEYKQTEKLEKIIAEFLSVKHCVIVNNGTISLSLALLALGVKAGDRVLIPNLTMVATKTAAEFIGAIPVMCDVNDRLLLDHVKAKKMIESDSTIKALLFVSLNGRSFGPDMWEFIWWCKERGIRLLEDAAQSFGSKNYEGYSVGARGFEIGSFSFSMPKIITTGQGGCLVTDDDALAKKLRKLKDFGRSVPGSDVHEEFGINSKFTEMQAVIGLAQMQDIKYRIERKKEMFKLYREHLKNVDFIDTDTNFTLPWFMDIFLDDPVGLQKHLSKKGIGSRLMYRVLKDEVGLEKSKRYSSRGIWLPSSFDLRDLDIIRICNTVNEFTNEK